MVFYNHLGIVFQQKKQKIILILFMTELRNPKTRQGFHWLSTSRKALGVITVTL